MTSVQFYLIKTDNASDQFTYALQLALQQLARGKHLHIHTASAQGTQQMQKLFVGKLSHGQDRLTIDHQAIDCAPMPVKQSGHEPETRRDVLLNLSAEVPHFFSSFESTLEVICTDSAGKDTGRERYRYYKSRGYPLIHCDVPAQLAL